MTIQRPEPGTPAGALIGDSLPEGASRSEIEAKAAEWQAMLRGPFDQASCDALGCADENEWRAELMLAVFYARGRVDRLPPST